MKEEENGMTGGYLSWRESVTKSGTILGRDVRLDVKEQSRRRQTRGRTYYSPENNSALPFRHIIPRRGILRSVLATRVSEHRGVSVQRNSKDKRMIASGVYPDTGYAGDPFLKSEAESPSWNSWPR